MLTVDDYGRIRRALRGSDGTTPSLTTTRIVLPTEFKVIGARTGMFRGFLFPGCTLLLSREVLG